jgi:O-antigen/teichoic acid export membrane protein
LNLVATTFGCLSVFYVYRLKINKEKLMIISLHKIKTHPKYEQVLSFFRLTVITGSAQLIIQVVSLVSGIVIIRLLPPQEYAFYTIANAMLGTMSLLADGGISTGVMSQGGKVWDNKEKLGVVLFIGMKLRRKFSLIILAVILPLFGYLLFHQNASLLATSLIILSVIPAYYASLSDSLLEIIPKLHQDIKPLQQNQMTVGVSRLTLSAVFLFFFPWAFVAVIAAGVPRIICNIKLRAIADKFTIRTTVSDPLVEAEIMAVVKRSLPGLIYYCLSGQITIWILSFFGNSTSLAASGALSRLGMALNVLTVMMGTLVFPRFARLTADDKLLLNRFLQILACIAAICCLVQILVFALSSQLLFVLGPTYFHLDKELFVYFLGCNVTLLYSTCYGLSTSRGWIIKPFFLIAYNIVFLIVGVLIFNVSTLMGVFWFTLFVSCSQLVMYFAFAIYKIYKAGKYSTMVPDSTD